MAKKIIRNTLIILAALAILIYAFRDSALIFPIFSKFFSEEVSVERSGKFDSDVVFASCVAGDELVCYETDSICFEDGTKVKVKVPEAKMKSNGEAFIVFSESEGKAVVFKGKDKAYTIEGKTDIQLANVSENGSAVIVTSESGYRSKLTVYSDEGEKEFSASFGSQYVIDAALSSNGQKIAVCLFDASGDEFKSTVRFYDIDEKDPIAETDDNEVVFSNVKFFGNKSIAISDKKVVGFDGSGEADWQYSYDGAVLQAFSMRSDKYVTICLKKGHQTIVCIDKSGNNYSYEYEGTNIASLDANSDAVMAITPRSVIFVTTHGYEIARKEINVDVKAAYMLQNERAGVIVHSFGYDTLEAK